MEKKSNGIVFDAAFRTLLASTSDMVFVKDLSLTYVAASMPFVHMCGKERLDEVVGHTDFEIFENRALAVRYTDDDRKLLSLGHDLLNYTEPLTDSDGHARYSSTSKYILHGNDGEVLGLLGVSRDITREYMARRRQLQELEYLFELPEDTYAALYMDIEEWRIISHHRNTVHGYEIPVCNSLDSFAENALKCIANPEDVPARRFFEALSQESMMEICNSGVRSHSLEYLRTMPNGDRIWVRTDIIFVIDPETAHLCAMWLLKDINSQKQETINLMHAAEHDGLTGLLNRTSTISNIDRVLKEQSGEKHALFIVDVDDFKSVNDTLGHQMGDKFLTELSDIMRRCFGESSILGRFGGDEFFVMMKNVSDSRAAAEKAELLLANCQNLCRNYHGVTISLSIGISMFPGDGKDLDSLYSKADSALYEAKRNGKNCYVII